MSLHSFQIPLLNILFRLPAFISFGRIGAGTVNCLLILIQLLTDWQYLIAINIGRHRNYHSSFHL